MTAEPRGAIQANLHLTNDQKGFRLALEEGGSRSHIGAVQAPWGCTKPGPALWADHPTCRSTEDMPCELSILLPSIVRPSVSTGCFPSSISSPAMTAPRPAIRPTISSGPARTPTASASRWRASPSPSFSIVAKENTLTIRGEKQDQDRREDQGRDALSGHRRARLRARVPARRPCRGQGREPRERSPARRPRARDPRGQ